MASEKKSFLEILSARWITPLLGIVTGIYGVLYYSTDQELERAQKKLEKAELEIKIPLIQKEFDNTLKLEIFKQVKEITSQPNDTGKQRMVNLIVTEMLADYPDYRDNLLALINSSPLIDTTIKRRNDTLRRQESQFVAMQKELENVTTTGKTRVDVFFLDAYRSEAEHVADRIVDRINKAFPGKYIAKKVFLPKSINSKSVYRVGLNQIKYEKGERDEAKKILDLINNEFPLEKPFLKEEENNTPKYIRVFVKNK